METAVFVPLLLLICSVSTDPDTKNADYKQSYDHRPLNIPAVLRKMEASLAAQKAEIRQLQKDNEAQAEKQKTELDMLKQQLQARQVAFSAALYNGHGDGYFGPFNKQIHLVFKYVATNVGQAYNPHTGVFTAPLRGAYHFEFHVGVHGDGKHPATAFLMKNRDVSVSVYELQTAHYGSASNGVTLILEVGDQMFLRMSANSRLYDDRFHYCTFSGHLIFAM